MLTNRTRGLSLSILTPLAFAAANGACAAPVGDGSGAPSAEAAPASSSEAAASGCAEVVQEGEVIDVDGAILLPGGGERSTGSCAQATPTPKIDIFTTPAPPVGGWQVDRDWTSPSPLGLLVAQAFVPAAMSATDGNLIYFQTAVTAGTEMFLPTVGGAYTGEGWEIQSYYVSPGGKWYTSTATKVNPGDILTFTIQGHPSNCKSGACLWTATVYDVSTKASTTVSAYTKTSFYKAYGGIFAGYPSYCPGLPSKTVGFVNLAAHKWGGTKETPVWSVGDHTGMCGWSSSSPGSTSVDLIP